MTFICLILIGWTFISVWCTAYQQATLYGWYGLVRVVKALVGTWLVGVMLGNFLKLILS